MTDRADVPAADADQADNRLRYWEIRIAELEVALEANARRLGQVAPDARQLANTLRYRGAALADELDTARTGLEDAAADLLVETAARRRT